jgi:alpha-glucoside transport system substrate-binding protein
MRKRWLKLAAPLIAFTFVAAACSTEDDDDGAADTGATEAPGDTGTSATGTTGAPSDTGGTTAPTGTGATESTPLPTGPGAGSEGTVTIFGVENAETDVAGLQAGLDVFAEESGIEITYVGARDFEQQINSQVLGGNPPDIAIFPQPGKVAQFAQDEALIPIPDETVAAVAENWDQSFLDFTNIDGVQYGVPNKNDVKSLVWYVPSVWAEAGYEIPETLADFNALIDQMITDGNIPLCVGIESGPATGWPFTDWVEELVLREQGIDFYNQWVNHEIPFNDPAVVDIFNQVAGPDGFWRPDAVFAVDGSIAATAFGNNAEPLMDGECMMHRQANFFGTYFADAGAEFGDGPGQVSYFYFPADEGHPVLTGGTSAAAFRDAPEVWQVMEYLGSPEYADARQQAQTELAGGAASGFLSANKNADQSLYSEFEQGFIEILAAADPGAFDASDTMPADVGSGTFWTEGTSFVNGDIDAQTAADNIEASWPT